MTNTHCVSNKVGEGARHSAVLVALEMEHV
jgi:hypothetical protein